MVKSEQDGTVLLDSEIRSDTNYSKQQETLIVWSEDSSDLALSFQERMGCEEIWEKICQQQVDEIFKCWDYQTLKLIYPKL